MLRVRVYSWFYSGNIGDVLIADQISNIFKKQFQCKFFDVTSGTAASKPKLSLYQPKKFTLKGRLLQVPFIRNFAGFVQSYSSKTVYNFKKIQDYKDLAVFAGGNLLMELSGGFPGYSKVLYRRVRALKKQGIPVAFCFCGVGPFQNAAGRRYAKKILKLLSFISVRDESSKKICEELGYCKKVEIWRDPVLLYEPKITAEPKNKVAVNVYFGTQKKLQKKMQAAYCQLVNGLCQQFKNCKISLFASETADFPQVLSVAEHFKNNPQMEEVPIQSEKDLISLYSKSLLVVGARMHSLITAVVSNCPIVAVSWQAKVTAFTEFIGLSDYCIAQAQFCNSPKSAIQLAVSSAQNFKMQAPMVAQKLQAVRNNTEMLQAAFVKQINGKAASKNNKSGGIT